MMKRRFFYSLLACMLALLPSVMWADGTIEYTVTDYDGLYDGQAHGISVNVTSPAEGATVTYGFSYNECNSSTSPTYTNKGTYCVYFKIEAEGYTTVMGGIGTVNIATDPTAYVELVVNNDAASFDADDATYDLTFKYDASATAKPADTATKKYFYLNAGNNPGGWSGYRKENASSSLLRNTSNSACSYAPKVTNAILESDFTTNVTPTNCACWFTLCAQISTISGIDKLDTHSCTSMNSMFLGCVSLSTLDVSHFDTSSVTDMRCMFYNCYLLPTLAVENFNTSNLTMCRNMFHDCKSIPSLTLTGWDVSKVTDFEALFTGMTSLTSLNLSTWNLPTAASYYSMFSGLSSLETLDISNLDLTETTRTEGMFQGCTKLKTIYVGDKWSVEKVESPHYVAIYGNYNYGAIRMFQGCTSLVGGSGTKYREYYDALYAAGVVSPGNTNNEDILAKWVTNSNINKSYARPDGGSEAPGLLTSTRSYAVYDNTNHVLYLCNRGFNDIYSKRTNAVTGVVETYPDFTPAGGASAIAEANTVVMEGLSDGWDLSSLITAAGITKSSITSVVIESSFGTQRPTTCADWFSGMTNATITGLENLNTTNVTSMANMFKGTPITAFDQSAISTTFKTSNVTDMSGMFEDCSSLSSITFGSTFDTGSVTTMANMFKGTAITSSIDLSRLSTSNVTDMSGMFQGCTALVSTKAAPFALTGFDTEQVTNLSNMFNGCTSLGGVDLSTFRTSNVTNMDYMFNGCSALTTIFVSPLWDNSKAVASSNNHSMFYNCTSLVGGSSYAYNAGTITDTYARIDQQVDGADGYLTEQYPLVLDIYPDKAMGNILSAYNGQRVTANVHRAFTADKWTTLCLPFDMTTTQISTVFGSGTQLKKLSDVTRSGATVTGVSYTNATTIEAGKPYLIKPANSIAESFHLANRTIKVITGGSTSIRGFAMRGVLTPTTISTAADEVFYTLNDADLSELPTFNNTNYVEVTSASPATLDGTKAYFSATTAEYVTVTIPAQGVTAFSSIYDIDFSGVSGCKAYIGVWWKVKSDGTGDLTIASVTDVPAGTGLIVKGTQGTYNIPISQSKTVPSNLLVAVPEGRRVYETEGDYTNYGLRTSTGQFVKLSGYGNFGVGKAYLSLPTEQLLSATSAATSSSSAGAPARFRLIFVDDIENYDETTGIDNVENGGNASAKKVYYNLQGQRVNNPTRGIYIVNGKKVFVK